MSEHRKYIIEPTWERSVPDVREQAINFWHRETELPEGQLLERADQLVVVARSIADQSVAAVSTAFVYRVPKLDLKCYFFRMYVGSQHRAVGLRTTGLASEVLHTSCEVLTRAALQDREGGIAGIYFQIQNQRLQRFLRRLVEEHRGRTYFYLGTTPEGFEERIHYFEPSDPRNRGSRKISRFQ